MSVRRTIILEEQVLQRAQPFVGRRGLSRFVNEAIAEKVESLERQRIEQAMIEGYIATRAERDAVAEDWAAVDLEGWPE